MGEKIHKTTQGIMISPVENSNILLLDNQGVDGFEDSKDENKKVCLYKIKKFIKMYPYILIKVIKLKYIFVKLHKYLYF